ncbi:MAG: hypothetical protein K2K32_08545, partial [Muribaculaceae bacterium]|nr:hypothetical protein [Muribaculaceae bacterium]
MKNASTIAILFALTASQFSFAQDHHKALSFSAPVRKARQATPTNDSVQTPVINISEEIVAPKSLRANSMVDAQKEALLNDHKIIYIDGRPENTNSKQHQDSI